LATYLDRILEAHRERARADRRTLDSVLERAREAPPARGFARALRAGSTERLAVIAEVKRRSPSKGDLAADLDPAATATAYASGGATALSVLTDGPHFGGSAEDLQAARAAVELPVLRKDFTVDARDVADARAMGADAVLLIVAALDPAELADLGALSAELGLDVLLEVHDEAELERGLAATSATAATEGPVVGVNQRDLVTFEVDHARAVRVGAAMPAAVVRVAESGVRGPDDAAALAAAGFHAVLVGESVVTSGDRAAAVAGLRAPRK
jgi:indole-3-glycerol phosphate synthase